MQRGLIIIWSGAIVDIPSGWVLCDGNNGTPDLRDRFIVGAGDTYSVDDTGGAVNHNHPFTGDGHYHNVQAGTDIGTGADYVDVSTTDNAVGTTNNADGRPPYYALAFVMKT